MSTGKLAIIALDGASPELVERWADAGFVPHLKGIMERGTFGPLRSVLPPVTGAAWGSFLTGLVPGRHGIFEWLERREGSYRLELIDSAALHARTLFEWLSAHGRRVGAVSVPLTYPIRPVEGFVISDLLTPPGRNYAHPPEIKHELEQLLARSYPVAPPPWRGRQRAGGWLKALKASLDARGRAAVHLATRRDWDLFMAHFMETDSVQHQMWHLLDGKERRRYRVDPGGNPVLEVYQLADRWIGELMDRLGPGTTVWIISDHGFGPLFYNLHLNTWLLRRGLLKLKGNASTRLKRLAFQAGLAPENLYPWEERLGLLGRLRGERAYRWLGRFALSTQNIDWTRTLAYSYGNVGQVRLNRRGREPQGIVSDAESERVMEELEAALAAWRNPVDGEPVVERLFRKEEAYSERALARAPDLVFLPRDGYSPMGLSEFLSPRTISHPVAHSGWHRMDGVFAGAGGPLPRRRVGGLRLLDLFPTICALMGVPVPEDLDGEASIELLGGLAASGRGDREAQGFSLDGSEDRARGGAQPSSPEAEDDGEAAGGEAEEAEIRDRLRGLGYL